MPAVLFLLQYGRYSKGEGIMETAVKNENSGIKKINRAVSIEKNIKELNYRLENIEKRGQNRTAVKKLKRRLFFTAAAAIAVISIILGAAYYKVFNIISPYLAYIDALSASLCIVVVLFAAAVSWQKCLME